jgi:soluble lytic murein transglycosylase-like protein
MVTREITSLAESAAKKHNLPPRLVLAIVTVESAGKPGATRYEPAFFNRYIRPQNLPEAEGKGRATSWGLMQIMGETARTLGFAGAFTSLLTPAIGLEWGCRYLSRLLDRYACESWECICRAYNGGPGNRHNLANTYPAKVLAALGGEWPPKE